MSENGKGDIDRWYLFINLMSYVLPIVFLVSIQYGPVNTPGKMRGDYIRGWVGAEWKKLPIGVQVE
jgi:hypothetical protein